MKIVIATAPRALGDIEVSGLPFLGALYIATVLKDRGHETVLEDNHTRKLNISESASAILRHNPDVVGIAAFTHNRFQAIALATELKKANKDIFIFVGGPHFSFTAKNALEMVPAIDCVVIREGELTVKELFDVWPDKSKFKDILGIAYRDENGKVIINPDRAFIEDLEELPSLAWGLLDLSIYKHGLKKTNINMPAIGVTSGRGCPNRCIFCSSAAFCKSILRLRNPKSFVDEIELLYKKYGFRAFSFWDDTLTIVRKHVVEICNEIIKRKLDIIWYCRARVNTVDYEMLKLIKKSGCIRISFGIESGSPKILEIIRKNITLDQARRAVKWCSDLGFVTSLNFMVNHPYETLDDLKQTIEVMKEFRKIPKVICQYGFTLIYPGTELEVIAKKEGWLPKDFSWNSPFRTEKYTIIGEDPSVPYVEWPGAEIEKIKAIMIKELGVKGGILKKGFRKLKKARLLSEFKALLKIGLRRIKQ